MCSCINDNNLVAAACAGDEQAMSAIVKKLMPSVEVQASAHAGSGAITRYDLIQEGLLGVLNAIYSYNPEKNASFPTYAGVCISNSIASAVRAQNRKKHRPLNSFVSLDEIEREDQLNDDPESIFSMQENMALVFKCIEEELTELERNVVKLHISGKSYEKISGELGVSVKSTDNALARARKKIKAARNI